MAQTREQAQDEAHRLERLNAAVELVRLEVRARGAGLFVAQDEQLRLVISTGLDQVGLDRANGLWLNPSLELQQGAAFRVDAPRPYLVIPCLVEGCPCGLLYLELSPSTALPRRLQLLVDVIARALAAFLGRLLEEPVEEEVAAAAQADNLRALLERHEWNVSLVARVLGVTRMTIYNRLRRLGITRTRVPKSPPRRRPTSSPHAASALRTQRKTA